MKPRTHEPLRITRPGDSAEREADRLAAAALDPARSEPLSATAAEPALMRQVREPEFDEEDGFDLALQSRSATVPEAPSSFLDRVRSSGGGRPLDAGVRARMEHGFGRSFSGVRIHADGDSARLSDQVNARAFTHGSDVFFGGGEYAPGTAAGDRLLAHELAHTLQQTSPGRIARQPKKPAAKKKRTVEPSRMTDAEKIRLRARIRERAAATVKRWHEQYDQDSTMDAAEHGKWLKAFDDAVETAKTAKDRAVRLAYLETERDLFKKDRFYAWTMVRRKSDYAIGVAALAKLAEEKEPWPPELVAWSQAHGSRMRRGADVYLTYLAETWGYEKEQIQRRELATDEKGVGELGDDDPQQATKDPATGAGGGALGAETLEQRELLEELHTALGDLASESGLEYDAEALFTELSKLEPWERKDFYEFVRAQAEPTAQAGTAKNLNELLELFNKLDPSARETLRLNREIAEAEPGVKGASESVVLKLEGEVAAQREAADDARKLASDLERIRAMAMPPELRKELDGVSFDEAPFFEETAMLLGLLAGAGERSTLVKQAGYDLINSIVEFQKDLQRELKWLLVETGILTAASAATEGVGLLLWGWRLKRMITRLKKVKQLIDTARKVSDAAARVKRVYDIVKGIRNAYPRFLRWYDETSTEFVRLQKLLESFDPSEDIEAKLAEKEDELLEKLDEQLEAGLGDILEMLYIDEDASRDELRQILFDIPRGLTALEDMWWYYRGEERGKPHFADVLAKRALRAGRYLSPFVGFIAAEIAQAFRAAFPDRSLEERALGIISKAIAKPDRRGRHRSMFGRLSRRRHKIDDADLRGPLKDGTQALRNALDVHEPGTGSSEHWTPAWFKRAIRQEVKAVNAAFRHRTVPAKVKPAKKGGPPGPVEQVPLPPFRVKLKRPGARDEKLVAHVKLNPEEPITVDRLTLKDFQGEGIEYAGEEPRKEAIRRFLKDKHYDVLPHPASGEFIRLEGANTGNDPKRPYLQFVGTRIKPGIDKDGYQAFVDAKVVVGSEHDLPEGYFLSHQPLGVNVSLKKFLAADFKHLGLDENRRLVVGKTKAAPSLVAEGDFAKRPSTVRTEGYDHVAALDATLAPPTAGVPPFKNQGLTRPQWEDRMRNPDLKERPREITGKLGYVVRARAFGDKLDSRFLPELREEDDKGHMVARRFGSDTEDPYWNLLPMLRRKNQFPGEWFGLETDMAGIYTGKNAILGGYVRFALSIVYPSPKTRRPSRFVAKYEVFDANNAPVPGRAGHKDVNNE